jgi:hypothetical protein
MAFLEETGYKEGRRQGCGSPSDVSDLAIRESQTGRRRAVPGAAQHAAFSPNGVTDPTRWVRRWSPFSEEQLLSCEGSFRRNSYRPTHRHIGGSSIASFVTGDAGSCYLI